MRRWSIELPTGFTLEMTLRNELPRLAIIEKTASGVSEVVEYGLPDFRDATVTQGLDALLEKFETYQQATQALEQIRTRVRVEPEAVG